MAPGREVCLQELPVDRSTVRAGAGAWGPQMLLKLQQQGAGQGPGLPGNPFQASLGLLKAMLVKIAFYRKLPQVSICLTFEQRDVCGGLLPPPQSSLARGAWGTGARVPMGSGSQVQRGLSREQVSERMKRGAPRSEPPVQGQQRYGGSSC